LIAAGPGAALGLTEPRPASDLMIEAEHLRKTYGPTAVLDDVSLELGTGRGLTLLGANGTGKTTLLRILATLLRPTSGSLRIVGTDALKEPDTVRGAIDMVDALFKSYCAAQDETIYKFASDVYADQSIEIDRMNQMLETAGGPE